MPRHLPGKTLIYRYVWRVTLCIISNFHVLTLKWVSTGWFIFPLAICNSGNEGKIPNKNNLKVIYFWYYNILLNFYGNSLTCYAKDNIVEKPDWEFTFSKVIYTLFICNWHYLIQFVLDLNFCYLDSLELRGGQTPQLQIFINSHVFIAIFPNPHGEISIFYIKNKTNGEVHLSQGKQTYHLKGNVLLSKCL